tara:strand:+ start:95 stop:484 length:390 start_codon:yes stop_codon:yes gene_type:complete
MEKTFNVDIITPDKKFLSVDSLEVVVPSYDGLITILRDHIPIITFLRPGVLKIKIESNYEDFFIQEGTVEFFSNKLLILTSSIIKKTDLNKDEIEKMLKKVDRELEETNLTDKQSYILSHKRDVLKEIN